tara:strand:+ start:15463 stop:16263 length:801 start_codon:yes stop_codon:yes gene_type:complete
MLRSGSAFQFNLVCSLLEKTSSCIRHGRWERGYEKYTNEQIEQWANDKKTFHVIKSGRHPEEFFYAKKNLAKILYINRDIRDIAVAAKFKWGLTGSDLIVMLDRAQSSYQDMIENKAFENDWCLHQKYENVFRNNYLAVKQMAKFLEVKPTKEIIKEVIEECSIDNMLKISKSKTLRLKEIILRFLGKVANIIKKFLPPPYNKTWKLRKYYLWLLPKVDERTVIAPNHIEPTKGVPGAWKDILTKEEIRKFNARYGEYLKKENYSI